MADSDAADLSSLVNLREEVDGKVEAEPVLIIKDGDMGCHELPSKGLHWDVDCGEDKE